MDTQSEVNLSGNFSLVYGAIASSGRLSYRRIVERTLKRLSHTELRCLGKVSYRGRQLPLLAVESGPPQGQAPSILITAGVHGDENAGVFAALEFLSRIAPGFSERLRIAVLPCVNPTGFEARTLESATGVNINREFGKGSSAPEVVAVESWLKDLGQRFDLAMDLHEIDPCYRGEGFAPSDNPTGCYLYETVRERSNRMGRALIDVLPPGVQVCRWSKIYQDDNHDGVVWYPEDCHNQVYAEQTTLDAFLNERYSDHTFTTETPMGWPRGKRVKVQLLWIVRAINILLDRSSS